MAHSNTRYNSITEITGTMAVNVVNSSLVVTASLPTYTASVNISNSPSQTIPIHYAPNGGPGQDAFGRMRTSQPYSYFEARAINDQHVNLFWDFKRIGTSNYGIMTGAATFSMSIGGTQGDGLVAQTRQYMHYQPGKSALMFITFNFSGSVDGVNKRVGYFDDRDGYFLELSGNNVYLVERSSTATNGASVSEMKVSQSAWNIDKFNGTGDSGGQLDTTKTTFFALDFEWLGVGSVRAGLLNDNGGLTYIHRFDHVNNYEHPYIRSANLPVRMELSASKATTATAMEGYCTQFSSEGGYNPLSVPRSADRGVSTLTTDTTLRSLIQIRLKDSYNTPITAKDVDVIVTTANPVNFRWALLINPTFNTTGAAPSWVSMLSSSVEYDVSTTYSITNEGIRVAGGYASNTSKSITSAINSLLRPGISINGFKDTIVLAVQGTSGGNQTYLGGISWEEAI